MLRTAPRSFALAVTMSVLVGLLPAASTLAGPAAARPVSQAPAAAPPAPWRESAPRPVPASRAGTGLPQRVVAGAGGGPRISISVPERVVVGQPITIVVAARGLRDLAGFEAVLTFDTKAAEFDGVQQRQVALKGSGRAVTPLGAVELDQGVAFGLVSCPFSDCLARTRRAATGVRGDTELARISVIPRVAGTLEFGLGAAKSVDATGAPTSLALPSQMARVTVGASAGGSVHRAGGAPWRLGSTAAGTGTPGVPANLRKRDIAGARSVGFVDLAEAGRAWRAVREDGDPCSAAGAPADIDRDGCVDVTDVQLVARDLASTTVTTAELSSTRDLASTTVTTAELSSTRAVESDATSDVTLASSSSPLVLVVTSTGDQAEAAADQGDGVCLASSGCTLRAAITEANLHRGPDTIEFAIGGSGVRTITLGSSLPTVADESGGVTINGFSQPGSAANRHARASNADIRIQIVGAPTPAAFHGLMITSPSNVVRGLSFFNLKRGIVVSGFAAHHNTLAGLLVGTNAGPATVNGTSYAAFKFQSPLLSNAHGIAIELGAAYNTVGGRELADRNVVSGNGNSGIATFDEGTDHTLIVNNIAGLEPDGQLPRRNAIHGIDVNFNSSYSIIGGLGPNDRNVVSANESDAIELSHGSLTVGNRIIGNWVGTTADGLLAPRYLANQHTGINVEDGATNTLVWKNVVVNNGWAGPGYGGIAVDGWYAWGNTVVENFVGITPGGLTAANANFGVGLLNKAAFNTVGPGNVVTASPVGVWADGEDTDANTITGNTIHGTTSLGIDLAPAGVTVNDPGDADTGPNDRRNSPVLVSATANEVRGSACGGCTVDVYLAEPVATDRGSGGYGPGRTMVGSTRAAADGAFAASISGVAPNAILTATATDSSGNTSEFAYNLVPAGTTLATDRFTRRVSDAWGVADVGGAWATSGTAADFDVDGDAATALSPAAGTGRSATLAIVTPQDADQTLRVKASSLVGSHVYVVARRSSGAVLSEYRARLRLTSTGQAWLRASRVVANGSEVGIGTETQVAGVTVAPGSYVRLRFQAVGTAPTTLRLKAWSDGAPEPSAWGLVVTDAAAELQTAGAVGVRTYLGTGTGVVPTTFAFDDYVVTAPSPVAPPAPSSSPAPTPTPPPPTGMTLVAADTFSRTVSDAWGRADTGGVYTIAVPYHGPAEINVDGSRGRMVIRTAGGAGRSVYLNDVWARDSDTTFKVSTDTLPAGDRHSVQLVLRRVTGNTEYRARLQMTPAGSVLLQAFLKMPTFGAAVGSEAQVAGLVTSAGATIRVRTQITGVNPTTIRMKAWADGRAEPTAWQYTGQNGEPALQTAGTIGLTSSLGTSSTALPTTFSYDDLSVLVPDTERPGPTATPAPTATVSPTPTLAPTPTPTVAPTPTPTVAPTPTPTVAPTPSPVPKTYALDTFTRRSTDTWGSAETGGSYTLGGGASADFDVDGASGTTALPGINASRSATLSAVSVRDSVNTVRFKTNKQGLGTHVYLVSRRTTPSTGLNEYRTRARIGASGELYVSITRVVDNVETTIAAEQRVAGVTVAAGAYVWLKSEVTGVSPTRIRAKAWLDGQAQPAAWLASTTDSATKVQQAGNPGVRVYVGSSANVPLIVSFDDFSVVQPPT